MMDGRTIINCVHCLFFCYLTFHLYSVISTLIMMNKLYHFGFIHLHLLFLELKCYCTVLFLQAELLLRD